ncbi:MAG: glycosyltransferase family 39 protein [Chloroflexota bacterium]
MNQHRGPSRWGWALLLLAAGTAVFLRFWQLGEAPPGLYHDEAYNGLDAVRVLAEGPSLYFEANNGREPAYILLTAMAVAALGETTLALRLTAAVVGSLTIIPVYLLADGWFGRKTALFAVWLWAVTLWPLHLSRIGLRAILLVPLLALTFWLGTLAFRRQKGWLWLLAGLVYGLSFYTYLAARFTPLLLALLLLFLLWRGDGRRLWPGVGWFVAGTAVSLFPLALLFMQNPDLIFGRSGQVSILNADINGGDLWGTLLRQIGLALGMFLWQGDTILRHNPAGRPVFDWLMALPFLLGLGWCLVNWKRAAALTVLLWVGVMLWPTILAEDTPHFLRAVGVLPAALLLPAIGLAQLWDWPRLPRWLRHGLVVVLVGGSLLLTVRDYVNYSRQPDVAYLFETAVTDLAQLINQEEGGTAVFLDEERFWQKYAALRFLVPAERVRLFRPENGLPIDITEKATLYAWPFADQAFVEQLWQPPSLVTIQEGSLARGDLEAEAYTLFVRYHAAPAAAMPELASFGAEFGLHEVAVAAQPDRILQVDLVWSGGSAVPDNRVVFVHVVGPDGLIAQDDGPPGQGYWQAAWWQPGLFLRDRHELRLPETAVGADYKLHIGWYDGQTLARLPVVSAAGAPLGDAFIWPDHGVGE